MEDSFVSALDGLESVKAGGGSSKDICEKFAAEPSCPLISVEEAGVGGRVGRGIFESLPAVACPPFGRGPSGLSAIIYVQTVAGGARFTGLFNGRWD